MLNVQQSCYALLPNAKYLISKCKNIKCSLNVFYSSSSSNLNVQQQLSPYDVNCILRENEFTHSFVDKGILKGYDSNQLGSNFPIEDSRSEATFLHKNGFVCGVFDGHGGPSCSQVISKRLLRYIAAGVLNQNILNDIITKGGNSQSLLQCHNDKVDFVKEVKGLYEKSFQKYVNDLGSISSDERSDILQHAFQRLDDDLSSEALNSPNVRTMSVAMSGAVACVAVIEDTHLYVANTGDCGAVLGSLSDTGQWETKKLTREHNSDNNLEIHRILDEHPEKEKETVIRNERLLGQLAPLRALGDFRFKWSNEILEKVVVPQYGEMSVPPHYYTPPYLTGIPDVTCHSLKPNDTFLVIGSDGLWDFLSPSQVVSLVGEHIASKAFLQPLKLPPNDVTLGQVSEILAHRKTGRKKKPLDKNVATHIIRNALGGTEYGIEHSKLSHLLSLPQDVSRLYRDDITITVLFFNQEFIRNFST